MLHSQYKNNVGICNLTINSAKLNETITTICHYNMTNNVAICKTKSNETTAIFCFIIRQIMQPFAFPLGQILNIIVHLRQISAEFSWLSSLCL
jgi:hypothetical protein